MFTRSLLTLGTLFAATGVHATSVNYTDWVYNSADEIDWMVTVEESTYDNGGVSEDIFSFDVNIGDQDLVGDIIGFGFNTDIDYGSSVLDGDLISFADSPDFSSCGSGCNWNGTGISLDYSFMVGNNGLRGGSDDNQSFSFGLLAYGNALQLDTFSLVAIRATSVGSGDDREESVKNYSATVTIEDVPELNGSMAATMFALMASIVGFNRNRRRRS